MIKLPSFLKQWDLARIIRLLLGLSLAVTALMEKEFAYAILALVFLLQAAFNIGCCGSNGCSTSAKDETKAPSLRDQIKPYKPN